MATATSHEIDLAALERLRIQLQLTKEEVAAIVGVNPSTLWRWQEGTSVPRGIARSRLAQFAEFGDLLRRLFAGPDLARTWLREAQPEMLGGHATPLAAMLAGRLDRVVMLLHFLARGA